MMSQEAEKTEEKQEFVIQPTPVFYELARRLAEYGARRREREERLRSKPAS